MDEESPQNDKPWPVLEEPSMPMLWDIMLDPAALFLELGTENVTNSALLLHDQTPSLFTYQSPEVFSEEMIMETRKLRSSEAMAADGKAKGGLVRNDNEGQVKGEDGSNAKKKEHNAKERERRMKLSETYLSLRALLPNSRRSKKRWSSAIIIDRVLDYIPKLEKDIEKLNQKKEKLLKAAMEMKKQRSLENQPLKCDGFSRVSIHQLRRGELIIQTCMQQMEDGENMLSTLIHNAEAEGMQINGASAVSVSDDLTLICHLHLKMNGSCSLQEAADYETMLREKVISWLH